MNVTLARKLAVSMIVAAFGVSGAPVSYAQDNSGATDAAPSTKAQRKAARKDARAKKNAELKKLEGAGYNPAQRDDASYPQDIQSAQKKAGIGQ
ncbi:hypothetical protein P9239_21870 [Caballeronia sp. LZ062]|uniref:DUF4148 domain-containing protein n=1 Tax=unclassified Caballeronia TaxID=2646786 RepID=UPI0028615947|nr:MULTISPECIES: DUF4148 domain-containing protein [unclassified Caballeronia]MDR5856330.1 hypothetical protein [Caballeronia sp. LZ050]MDR5873000.1 hypothetical protein [Caballeronia sp. LZ062]